MENSKEDIIQKNEFETVINIEPQKKQKKKTSQEPFEDSYEIEKYDQNISNSLYEQEEVNTDNEISFAENEGKLSRTVRSNTDIPQLKMTDNNIVHLKKYGCFVKKHKKFQFELKSKTDPNSLEFFLYRNKYQNNKTYKDEVIRGRLKAINDYLDALRIKEVGTHHALGYLIYAIGVGAIGMMATVQEYATSSMCPDSLGAEKQSECEDGVKTLGILSAAYTGLFFTGFLAKKYGGSWLESAKYYKGLYQHYKESEQIISKHHTINDPILEKKMQFIKYIQLKFWEETAIVAENDHDMQRFLKSFKDHELMKVNILLVNGLFKYFIDLNGKLKAERQLLELMQGSNGQQKAESIVDTLVKIYKSKVRKSFGKRNFESVMKSEDVAYLADSVMGTQLYGVEHSYNSGELENAELLISKRELVDDESLMTRPNQKMFSDRINTKKMKEEKREDKEENKRGSITQSTVVPFRMVVDKNHIAFGNTPKNSEHDIHHKPTPEVFDDDNEINSKLNEVILDNQNDIDIKKSPLLERNSIKKGKTNFSMKKNVDKEIESVVHSNNKKLSKEQVDRLYDRTVVTKYVTESFDNTIDNKRVTQKVIDYIFKDIMKDKKPPPTISVMQDTQRTIRNCIINKKIKGDTLFFVSTVLQSWFSSLPLVTLGETDTVPPYAKILIGAGSTVFAFLLEIPKNGLEKEKKYAQKVFDDFESTVRNMLNFNLLNINLKNNMLCPNRDMQHVQLIAISTTYLIADYHEKSVDQFNKNDLAYLNMHIITNFINYFQEQ